MRNWIAIVVLLVACESLAHAQAKTAAPTKWRFEVKGAAVSYAVVAPDGDVILGGGIKGSVKFGSQALRSDDEGVWVARLTSSGSLRWAALVDPPTKRYVQQYLSALSVAADGSVRVDVHRREAPYLRRVTITADGATQTVDALVPDTKVMTSSVFANGDALVSAEPGPKDKCKGGMLQRLAPGGKRVWATCNKVEVGALHRTSLLADGRSAMCANEWIGEFATKGKRTWEAKHPDESWCKSIALFESGDVVAAFDEASTMTAMLWKSNGKLGWTKKCTDLVKGSGSCLLDGLAVRGTDVILTVRNGATTLIAVLEGKTGAVKKSYPLQIDASIRPVTSTETAIVFGTISPDGFTVESIDR